ncbi:MAG TPA: glycosyltransferase [Gemmatirosa sp.]|nr:glycosyltransferase [Gemmatirosa sp.]
MRVVLFCHSIASDWNHGNAHFLRGVARALRARGHAVTSWEPDDAWSAQNLVADRGPAALDAWLDAYPDLAGVRRTYAVSSLGRDEGWLDAALDGADLVIVHEWSDHRLVAALGARRAAGAPWRLLFHDTHHRSVSDPASMAAYDLAHYDGVLAFGDAVRAVYEREGWARRAWTWHEAADPQLFRPMPQEPCEGDLVWIGNWGDDERTEELREFLVEPARCLGLRARVHGVRYPDAARAELAAAGIHYAGSIANHEVPRAFARFAVTVHVPRRPYVRALPGVPTIRVFEALACGIPLVSAPWPDVEHLFAPGEDFLVAADGRAMRHQLRAVLHDTELAHALALRGRRTVLARHTCAHRVDELLAIARTLGIGDARAEVEGEAVHGAADATRAPHPGRLPPALAH